MPVTDYKKAKEKMDDFTKHAEGKASALKLTPYSLHPDYLKAFDDYFESAKNEKQAAPETPEEDEMFEIIVSIDVLGKQIDNMRDTTTCRSTKKKFEKEREALNTIHKQVMALKNQP